MEVATDASVRQELRELRGELRRIENELHRQESAARHREFRDALRRQAWVGAALWVIGACIWAVIILT